MPGDVGLIPGSGRSPGEGNGNPLQYSGLKSPIDREACQATIHGVTKSRTWLSNWILLKISQHFSHGLCSNLEAWLGKNLLPSSFKYSICQQIWKTQKWPQDWKRSVFIPIPKKDKAKECSNYCTIALISQANGEGNSTPLQYSCLENPMGGGAWCTTEAT